jgi:hypothetical protein
MEILLELAFEAGMFVIELFGEAIFRLLRPDSVSVGTTRKRGERRWAQVITIVLGVAAGIGFGLFWGTRQRNRNLPHIPYALWWSLLIGGIAAALLFLPGLNARLTTASSRSRAAKYFAQRTRLWLFLCLNLAVAVGILVAWQKKSATLS